ncbi:unnamed protein product [Cyclocybe aegerita]|uniref:Uncharacterized protein n=1 Tax=Cyclocybe aegerita TaxID=1973307 RepID=A0A8S0X0J8_CYCAE|nr:unnamed protein product [Cyclocybe aegerita]
MLPSIVRIKIEAAAQGHIRVQIKFVPPPGTNLSTQHPTRPGLPNVLFDGLITPLRPLHVEGTGCFYGIIFSPTFNQLVIGRDGGKGSRHGYVTQVPNVMAASNIGVQIFEHALGSKFRSVPHSQAFHVKRFDFVPPRAFLCGLSQVPEVTENALHISRADWEVFSKLMDRTKDVVLALKAFSKRAQNDGMEEDDE